MVILNIRNSIYIIQISEHFRSIYLFLTFFMKQILIIMGINFSIITIFSFFLTQITHPAPYNNFSLLLGYTTFFGGILAATLGLLFLLIKDKRFAVGFLLSGGVLIILGSILCSINT